MTNSPIRQVNKSGEVSIPPDCKDHLGIGNGDFVKFNKLPDGTVQLAKWVPVVFLIAIAIVIAIPKLPAVYADEQQVVVTSVSSGPTNVTSTAPHTNNSTSAQPQQHVVSSEPLTFEKSGKAGYLPFKIDITYPEGQSLIQNITHVTPGSRFDSNFHSGFPQPGLTTYEFSTAMQDEYSILIGQNYNERIDQPVIIHVWSGNATDPESITVPVHDNKFLFQFKIKTTPEPHIPTPQELNALNVDYFNKILQSQTEVKTSQGNLDKTISITANVLQGTTGLAAIVAMLLLAAIIVLLRFNRKRQTDIHLEEIKAGETS